eukprot:3567219-Pyramimonas_sp.AAC.2
MTGQAPAAAADGPTGASDDSGAGELSILKTLASYLRRRRPLGQRRGAAALRPPHCCPPPRLQEDR